MQLFSWFQVIGGNLLLLTHVSHSLVLLTANVEDIKRIAQKFVSESLAEKLADLIVKATGKEIDVSVENNENDGKVHDISGNEWNVNRKKDLSNRQKQKSYTPKTTPSEIYHKSKDKKTRFNLKSYRDSEETKPNPKPHLKSHGEIKHRQNPYTFNIRKRIPVIVSQDERKGKHKHDNLKEDVIRGSSNGDFIDEVMKRANTITTKKERNEFDQYDNTNYPKAEVIATSGAVSLTKRPEDSESDENKEYE